MIRTYSVFVLAVSFVAGSELGEKQYQVWTDALEGELVDVIARNDLGRQVYKEVVSQLREDDIPADFVHQTFSYSEITIDGEVVTRLNHPVERLPYHEYRKIFLADERVEGGIQFHQVHKTLIEEVADSFGIDPILLVSIVGIESKYGTNSHQFSVFNALHTIIHKFPRREKWVEREMVEYLKFCYENFIPPHTIYGSYVGAFGYGQFIPSSFNRFSVDFNGDGIRHPFDWPDVLASIANYLVEHGYEKGSGDFSRRSANWKAVLAYNRSAKYVSAVLELRDRLISVLEEQG